ncbi:CHAT domain-containing protein [uncultured Desulfobacter sp.]|uniref:CHAT domain-containing protein n=1 Tax=uncultured Desulfobacter sp. TaxID=240139 RepID=UPI0029C8C51B|nr:CHAT domain-containing protein [uncultured Desulfobacter sp.]
MCGQKWYRITVRHFIFITSLLFGLVAWSPLNSAAANVNEARSLQETAIERIERYVDHFRRTFDRKSLRHELIRAQDELEDSIRIFGLGGVQKEAAYSLVKLGDIRRYLDNWDSAISTYEQAARLARDAGAPAVECKALLGISRAYLYGKKTAGPAFEIMHHALPLAQKVDDPTYIFDAWDLLAQIQLTQGDYIGAADSISRAFYVQDAIKDDKLLYYGYLDRADVYQKFAEKCDYQRDFNPCLDAVDRARRDYQAALALARKLQWAGLAGQTQKFIQRLEIRKQMIQRQQSMHKLMIESRIFSPRNADDVGVSEHFTAGKNPHLTGLFAWLENQGGMPPLTDARGAYIKGLLNESAGNSDEALEWYLRATDLLEEDRGFLFDESARGAYVEDKVEFYNTAILHLLDQRRMQDAFNLMERSRSRVMSDLIATKDIAMSSPRERLLYADRLQLHGRIAQIQACLYALRNGKQVAPTCSKVTELKAAAGKADRGIALVEGDGAEPAIDNSGINISDLENVLKRLQDQYNAVHDRMVRETPRLARLVKSEPVTLGKLQKTLAGDGSEMIMYLSLESQVIVWHIGPDSIYVRSVFLPRSVLKDKIERLRKTLLDPRHPYDTSLAHELFLYLIAPVLNRIKSDHLVIVPHEDLHYLPFQALQMELPNGFLGEAYQISYAPSATILASLAPSTALEKPSLLAVADPSLRYAPAEVHAIGERFSGHVTADRLPTETEVKAWMPAKGLVHLAVHGSFAADEPLLSYLHLNPGKSDDGRLTAAEMYGLPLDSARLVVLSACETGNVRATHASEVIGMMRGLIFAGADALLLSAWKIDDKATAEWMQAFYAAAISKPPTEAARAAVRDLRRKPAYQHPFYWSPFLLISR